MKVGIQLYSVRNHMAENPLNALREVAKRGYSNFEIANPNALSDPGVGFGVPAKEIQATLEEIDARIVSGHIMPLTVESVKPVLDYHTQIGTEFLAIPMDFYTDRDDVLRKAETINAVGELCKNAGIELLYHNHFHEFQVFAGEEKSVYQLLLEHTDPALLGLEIDTYWAMRGGKDPVALIQEYGKRVRLLHQKDMPRDGFVQPVDLIAALPDSAPAITMDYFRQVVEPTAFTEPGTGRMDIQAIIDAGNTYGAVDYIILEQDFSARDEMESISISRENFAKYSGLTF